MKLKHYDIEIPPDEPFRNCKLDREQNAAVLTQIVRNYADGFVLSVNGAWGSGKTTFMKMWAADLEREGIKSIYFNAWENDFMSDPMVALLGELKRIVTDETAFKSLLKTVSAIAPKIGPAIAKDFVKRIGFEETAKVIEESPNAGVKIFEAEVSEYENKRKKLSDFRTALSAFLQKSTPDHPLVFIVDELDRCRPDYAVEVLERIKHFFSTAGIVFVLSIDKEQLCNSIRGHYGSDRIDAEEYLRRFIDVEYSLPEPDVASYCKYLYDYLDFQKFFESGERLQESHFGVDGPNFLKCAVEISNAKNYSLRQIEKLFVHTRLVLCSCGIRQYVFPKLTLMLLCIRAANPQFYQKITNLQLSIDEIVNLIPEIFPDKIFRKTLLNLQPASFWALAELFHCYAAGNARKLQSVKLTDDADGTPNLTFKIEYVDPTELAAAIRECQNTYRDAGWGHISKSIDLLNPIIETI